MAPLDGRPLRLLVVHEELPPHDRDSGSLRLCRIVSLLASEGHEVTFLARGGVAQERYAANLLRAGVREVIPVDPERLAQSGPSVALPPLDFAALCERGRFDAAWLSFHKLAAQYLPLLRLHSPTTKVIVDSVDVHWVRERRGAELSGDEAALAAALRTREIEGATYRAADLVVGVSEDDAAALRELAPEVPAAVVSNVHDIEREAADPAGRSGVVFVAHFPHAPNVDAALNFVATTWPQVRAALPGVHLSLVGNRPLPSVQALDGPDITVTGWVPEVDPYLDGARVAIAPLRYGAGVKGKIGQAMARGIPIVTTPLGAEGMGLVDGEHALIADCGSAFADAIVRLHRDDDLWTHIAHTAQAHLSRRFGAETTLVALRELLASLQLERAPAEQRQPRARAATAPRAAIVVQAAIDPETAQAQLSALDRAALGRRDDVELIVLVSGHDPVLASNAAALPAARVVRSTGAIGPGLARTVGLAASAAPVLVMLGPLAAPEPDFLDPLLAAVEGGASIAGPVIDGEFGYGERLDGSLWPRVDSDVGATPLHALALDCLAARREIWEQAPSRGIARDGHYESQLSRWARAHGDLAVAAASTVQRLADHPLSVIICTRDRAEELTDAVALLLASGVTSHGGEILIVDNGSRDGTAGIAAQLAAANPGVRLIEEPTPGLSHARNAGAAAAANDLLCYLDDDARPAPGWRNHIAWALTRPGVAAAGGPICALWPPEREPGWPDPGLEQYLSVCERGDADCVLVPPDVAYGANWAIRRDALQAVGGFHPDFGVAPDSAVGGEEVLVAWRLHRRAVGATLYSPFAAVGHRIEPHRVTDRWVLQRALRGGIEQSRLRVENDGLSAPRMVAEAQASANTLLSAVDLRGTLTLEEALDRIGALHGGLARATQLAHALGELAANTLQLGEQEVAVGELHLLLAGEHLRGTLASRETALAQA